MVSRERRAVFLEKLNKYVHNRDFNEDTLNMYAQQITYSFPESRKAVEKILSMDEHVDHSDEVLERQ